jgi:hypothetical protein
LYQPSLCQRLRKNSRKRRKRLTADSKRLILAARLSAARIGLFLSHLTVTLNSRAMASLVALAVSRGPRSWSSQSSSRSTTGSYLHLVPKTKLGR